MPFLNTEDFKLAQNEHEVIGQRYFKAGLIDQGAYQLRLGSEAYVTTNSTKQKLSDDKERQILIEPGQFGMLITKEIVRIPSNYIGLISIRYGKTSRGLINVSGFHVDPGYIGRIKFTVYNAGGQSIVLETGESMFPLWLVDYGHEPSSDSYRKPRRHSNKRSTITPDDIQKIQGMTASPSVLNERLSSLESKVSTATRFAIATALTFVAILLPIIYDLWKNILYPDLKSLVKMVLSLL